MVGVTLQDVSKSYDKVLAVDNVSLEIPRGDLFFLLGPSGCGKTTILRMMAGFLQPDEGHILFDERPIDGVPPHKRNTGMVFQSYALWPHMDVQENVAYGLHERKLASAEVEARTEQALRTVHMLTFSDRMPNQLSGGQQQRVALARALVIEPDVVLLDEPLSNLDAKLRLEMRHEIKRIHRETGVTMVYVTHDQKEALSMADRVAVMSMGRVQQVGTPREVYRRPANRFVAEFIGEANFLTGTMESRDGDTGVIRTDLGTFQGALGANAPDEGERAECMVRPEALRFQADLPNRLAARVSGSLYLGEVEQFVLQSNDRELVALCENPDAKEPETGAEVELSFDPDDAVILAPAEDAS